MSQSGNHVAGGGCRPVYSAGSPTAPLCLGVGGKGQGQDNAEGTRVISTRLVCTSPGPAGPAGPLPQRFQCPLEPESLGVAWLGLLAVTTGLPEEVKGKRRALPDQRRQWPWGRHVAARPGHTYTGTTWLWPGPDGREAPGSHCPLLARGAVALGGRRPLPGPQGGQGCSHSLCRPTRTPGCPGAGRLTGGGGGGACQIPGSSHPGLTLALPGSQASALGLW